jgi:Uroporphyrinogen decarboxylase (URO-D)
MPSPQDQSSGREMGESITPRQMAKELLSGNVPPRPLFLPIAFSLGARAENVPLRTFLSNPVKICTSARQIRSHLRADGAACYFDALLEAEALGATLVWETENGRAALHWSGHSGKGELPQGLRSPEDAVKSGRVPVATEVIRRLNAKPQREFLLMAGVSGPFTLAARLTQLSHQDSAIGKDLPQDALELSAAVITQLTSAFVEAGADVIFILEDVLPALDAEGCAAWASLLAPTINVARFYEALPVLVLTNDQSFALNSRAIFEPQWDCVVCVPLGRFTSGRDHGRFAAKGPALGIALPLEAFLTEGSGGIDLCAALQPIISEPGIAILTTAGDVPLEADLKRLAKAFETVPRSV